MNAFKPAFRPAIRPAITSVFGVQVPVVTTLSFVSQPQSKTVDEYALATFSCEVTGGVAPYSYQYKKNGANVGTNSAALSFAADATDNAASITVVVTDSAGTSITSTAAALGVTSYAFITDGLTQFISLSSEIVLSGDFDVLFTYKGLAADYKTFMAAANNDRFARFDLNGAVRMYCGYATPTSTTKVTDNTSRLIRFRRVGQVSSVYINGVLEGVVDNSISLGTVKLSKLMEASGSYAKGAITKLSVDSAGLKILEIPLNNKSQGANQLATVGSINATIVNYNAAGWTAV
ncbi:hypothetical protein GCM10009347_01730 [Shewanella algicola]|uniref:Ig-like domain-containing protein n=1 Tax=Shewanella algicola TaxID=640633 RepID=A0A9X1Z2H4_9GAMM|nr:hypothetical protein [Shewanella algicola]MCL1103725.1 hypothetical protein [Shewanella algicola]GGP37415.1 hypothetical protein GCM10009347_01730 [Shewanella algicola]